MYDVFSYIPTNKNYSLRRVTSLLSESREYSPMRNSSKFMIFQNQIYKNRTLGYDEMLKGRPREAFRNISYDSIDDIDTEDFFENFQKILNETEGARHRRILGKIHQELRRQQLRIKEETKTPHTKVYHFNDTENNSIEDDEELAEKMKEEMEKNLGIRVFVRKGGMGNNSGIPGIGLGSFGSSYRDTERFK